MMLLRLISIFILLSQSSCYLVRSAFHHNDLYNSRLRVEDVLNDPQSSQKTKDALHFVDSILEFAKNQDLHTEGAYRYLIFNDRKVVSYLVQASHPHQLKLITWWFPIVGRVPYLGFFSKTERDEKADELASKGFDVDLGEAGAFSSLGWFEDPIFSSMLLRSKADMAHLFFHELVHRTIWVPGGAAFNEQLAEYVSEILTEEFLIQKGLSLELTTYREKRSDRRLFQLWLKHLRSSLEELFNDRKIDRKLLTQKKKDLFNHFLHGPPRPKFLRVDYVAQGMPWNNATVLASSLYAPDLNRFQKAHACLTDSQKISAFLRELAKQAPKISGAEPEWILDRICSSTKTAPNPKDMGGA